MERLLSDEAMVEVIRVDLRYSNAGRAGQTIERIKLHASTYWALPHNNSLVADERVPVAKEQCVARSAIPGRCKRFPGL